MRVTTLHGIIGIYFISNDYGGWKHPVPLPYWHCDPRLYDHERKRQRPASVAYQPRPVDCRGGNSPWYFRYGLVLRVVRIVYQVFFGGSIP